MAQYGSRSKLCHIEKQVLEDYLWELKVSYNRHQMMNSHDVVVCLSVCLSLCVSVCEQCSLQDHSLSS